MKGSIFSKLLAVYLAVSLFSLGGLSVMISLLLESELRTDKQNELRKQAANLQDKLAEMTVEQLLSSDLKQQLKEELRTLEKVHNIRSTFIYTPKNTKKLTGIGLSEAASGWLSELFEGKQLFFVGSIENNGQELLTLGTPVMKDGEVLLIFLLAVPGTDLEALDNSLQESILIAFLITAVVISVLIYFVSKRMIVPINQLNDAASKIAKGHFHERVIVSGTNEISRLAGAFNEMAEKLDSIEQHRSRFISEVAHELRTPLTTILGTLRGLMDGTISPDEQPEFLQSAYDEVQRLGRLVNDLLELARFEEKAAELKNDHFNLSELVKTTLRAFKDPNDTERLTLRESVQPDIFFDGDEDRIRQVLVNLISNAIAHNTGPLTVAIILECSDDQLILSVQDTGNGIHPEHLPHIFERFYKADPSRSGRGSGLGLAISRSIIEQSGGSIQVFSGPAGTTFNIIFHPGKLFRS